MRPAPLLLALLALPVAAAAAQSPRVQRVDPTPRSARAEGAAALSTAQMGGAHDAEPPRTLPSLQAVAVGGATTDVLAAAPTGHWLLLVRELSCVSCDRVLGALAGSDGAALRSGSGLVVLVASGTARGDDRLHDLRARYNTLGNAVWLDDRQAAAAPALKAHAAATLYAMDGKRIAWSAPGLLGDARTLQALASAWVAAPRDAAKTTATPAGRAEAAR